MTGDVYVPKIYDVVYPPDGAIKTIVPNKPGVRSRCASTR